MLGEYPNLSDKDRGFIHGSTPMAIGEDDDFLFSLLYKTNEGKESVGHVTRLKGLNKACNMRLEACGY